MTGPLWTIPDDDGAVLAEAGRLADLLATEGSGNERPPIVAVVFEGLADPANVSGDRADEVIHLTASEKEFQAGSAGVSDRAAALRSLADSAAERPMAVLVPSSPDGDEFAAVVAARLRGGCVTDCLLRVREGELKAGRQVYEGRAHVEITFENGPAVVSLCTELLMTPDGQDGKTPPIRRHEVALGQNREVRQVAVRDVPEEDLTRTRRVVAGGHGLDGPDGFEPVRELADSLGATVGSSRPPADEGWVPYDRQIGVTGAEIDVDLYIPCAISGDPYHMRSVDADHLLPINTDPEAPIFNHADLGIVGDVFEYAPTIAAAIRDAKNEPRRRFDE